MEITIRARMLGPDLQPLGMVGKRLEIRIPFFLAGPPNDPADVRLAVHRDPRVASGNLRLHAIIHPEIDDIEVGFQPGRGFLERPGLVLFEAIGLDGIIANLENFRAHHRTPLSSAFSRRPGVNSDVNVKGSSYP